MACASSGCTRLYSRSLPIPCHSALPIRPTYKGMSTVQMSKCPNIQTSNIQTTGKQPTTNAASIATNGPSLIHYRRRSGSNPSSCNLCLNLHPKSPTTSTNINVVIIVHCAINRRGSSIRSGRKYYYYYDNPFGPIAAIHASTCAAGAAERASG